MERAILLVATTIFIAPILRLAIRYALGLRSTSIQYVDVEIPPFTVPADRIDRLVSNVELTLTLIFERMWVRSVSYARPTEEEVARYASQRAEQLVSGYIDEIESVMSAAATDLTAAAQRLKKLHGTIERTGIERIKSEERSR